MKDMVKVKSFFRKNLGTKILSVIFAIIVWFYVAELRSVRSVVKIPLKIMCPPNLTVTDISIRGITVTFRGTKEEIERLKNYGLRAVYKLPGSQEKGELSVRIGKNNIEKPKGVSVVKIEPKFCSIVVDEFIDKELEVRPVLIGQPEYGYKVVDTVSAPRKIMVRTLASYLESKNHIETIPIDLTGRDKSFTVRVVVEPMAEDGIHRIMGKRVVVTVEIAKALSRREFKDLPINVLLSSEKKSRIKLNPATAGAIVSGPKDILDTMSDKDISLFVEILNVEKGVYGFPIKADLPKKVLLEKTDPEVVEAAITAH